MKKFIVITALVLSALMSLTVFGAGVSVTLNGSPIDTRDVNGAEVAPFIQDGTTYVPVRAIATALNIKIDWDNDTRTVIIGEKGSAAPKLGEKVNVYINGAEFIPRDAAGKEVAPIILNGTTYLPVRAIAQAFAKKVDWDGDSSTVIISDSARINTEPTYKLTAAGTSSAITTSAPNSGAGLVVSEYKGSKAQLWQFIPVAGQDGFYQIVNIESGCAMDVNGQSRQPGAKILQYTRGDGDNQKFMLMKNADGTYKIYSKNSMLPFESSAGDVKQNADRTSSVQNWNIEAAEPVYELPEITSYKKLALINSVNVLTYSLDDTKLTAAAYTGSDSQKWELEPTSKGYYAVKTKEGGKSIDVANNSTKEGDPLITYKSSSDDNQRWILEKQPGGYKLKSVSSGLYAALASDGSIVQNAVGDIFVIEDAE